MKKNKLTKMQLAVINELRKAHLTSFQILKRIQGVSLILVVYNILDELKKMGILKSYMKQNMKYHYIVSA
jgi:Fe2+ or Zn2+ uptake regulation protein